MSAHGWSRAAASRAVERRLSWLLVAFVYGFVLLVCRLRRARPASRPEPRCLVLTGTFYNSNWFLSHIVPLARSGVESLVVVTEAPLEPVDRVEFACPPRWAVIVLGRTVAKLVWMVGAGLRWRPQLYMGYHVIPGAVTALVVARLFGRPACYQMTGGPIEVVGGGFGCENPVLARLHGPSPSLERIALSVVREFDFVIVRGGSARRFLTDRGVRPERVAVITGSVDADRIPKAPERTYDLVFVGRLAEAKQPLQFVEILAMVHRAVPSVRAVVIGDGPLLAEAQSLAERLGVAPQVEFVGKTREVEGFLSRSRVFVLTSRTEGLSIAMAEAMMAGAVPVVADVGDLSDLVRSGTNGYLVKPNDREEYARRVVALLQDAALWGRLSRAAVESAQSHVGLDQVTGRWARHLDEALR